MSDDLLSAELTVSIGLSWPGQGTLVWKLRDGEGNIVLSREFPAATAVAELKATLATPNLWWPHDHGKPYLYTSEVRWCDAGGVTLDQRSRRVGFRTVRLVMHEGAWDAPVKFPVSRTPPPITLQVNGRELFAKGSNFVSPEIFPGKIKRETYLPLLEAVVDTHFNLVRMWGGAIVQKEAFFDLCDELGIMVWQEFPLACNAYPDDPAYLAVLDRESRSIIRGLRPHPSVILWCGGNELFNSWSRMTDQSLALRLLNRNCLDLDPQRPFLPTSPVMGMGHGFYLFFNSSTREDAFSFFTKAEKTAYTEFGIPATPSSGHLKTFIPATELFPPRAGTAWETHHGLGAWDMDKASWMCQATVEKYLGPCGTVEELCAKSQTLQAQGYRALFEEARRQKPRCSMVMNWCFNEPWPAAANNSLIAWPFHPKPALETVKFACRPVMASARLLKYVWSYHETFDPELWLLSDLPDKLAGFEVHAFLRVGHVEIPLGTWDTGPIEPNRNLAGPTFRFQLPEWETDSFHLILRVLYHPKFDSVYPLVYRPSVVR